MVKTSVARKKNKKTSSDQTIVVSMEHVNKWFGQFHVLRDINLRVVKGERIVICGPSGSGKSTLIRCLNRLEKHQDGDINVHGIELNNDVKNIDEIITHSNAIMVARGDLGVEVPSYRVPAIQKKIVKKAVELSLIHI